MAPSEVRWAFNSFFWHPSKESLLKALSSISLAERERIQKFHFKRDFKASLAGRLMIRKCIHRQLGIPWGSIHLGRTEKSKPIMLDDQSSLSFNVSHQGKFVVLAASNTSVVGVDVMDSSRPNNTTIDNFFKLMRRQFTDPEWQFIHSWPDDQSKLNAFYRLWCLKESVVKAQGGGIGTSSADRMRFDVATRDLTIGEYVTDSVLYEDDKLNTGWAFAETKLDEDHIATVASIANHNQTSLELQTNTQEYLNQPVSSSTVKSKSSDPSLEASEIDNSELKGKSVRIAVEGQQAIQFHYLSESELLADCEPLCEPDLEWFHSFEQKK